MYLLLYDMVAEFPKQYFSTVVDVYGGEIDVVAKHGAADGIEFRGIDAPVPVRVHPVECLP